MNMKLPAADFLSYRVVLGLRYTRSVGQETTETLRTSDTKVPLENGLFGELLHSG
jgi:hypothetical protein